LAKFKDAETTGLVIAKWLSLRYTIDYMGIWKRQIIQFLMLPNSVTLEMKAGIITLCKRRLKIKLVEINQFNPTEFSGVKKTVARLSF